MINVVRFGPMDNDGIHDDRRTWGLVGCSTVGESILTVDRTQEEALARLVELADGEPVRCEPPLAAIAKRFGIPSAPVPPEAYEVCALTALELLSGLTMESDAGFIVLEACANFLAKKPWRRWPNLAGLGLIGLGVEVTGPIHRCAEACILSGPNDPEGFYIVGLFKDEGSVARFKKAMRDLGVCRDPGLVLVLSSKPAWAAEAVYRAYGHRFVVHVVRTGPEGPSACTEPEAVALAATMGALTSLSQKTPTVIASIETVYGVVGVKLAGPSTRS